MERRTILAGAAVAAGALLARALKRRAFSFRDRVVLITGGSRGLGLELARLFASEGAQLALVARDREELERASADLAGWSCDPLLIPCNLRDPGAVRAAVEQTAAHFGRLDVLVNDAGVIEVGPLDQMQIEDFEESLDVHFWAPLHAVLSARPHLRRQRGSRIVNIASIGGKVSVPHLLPYSAGKFALVGLSEGLRAELSREGIRVTTVCPGLMRTGSHFNAKFKGQRQKEFAWFSISNAFPLDSIDSRTAARQIVEACRRGDAELVITLPAKVLVWMNALFPGLLARALDGVNRILPAAAGPEGNEARTGWESQSHLAPSAATRLSDQATVRNNEQRAR